MVDKETLIFIFRIVSVISAVITALMVYDKLIKIYEKKHDDSDGILPIGAVSLAIALILGFGMFYGGPMLIDKYL